MTPDVNVLVAAFRSDHPHHAVALKWLHTALSQCGPQAEMGLLGTVVASFLRLVTHPKVFLQPTPMPQALAFVDAVLNQPGVRWLPMEGEWPQLRQLCTVHTLASNNVPDAWIAAAVLRHQQVLVTFDRDFKRLLPSQQLLHLQPATTAN
jgi:toxin-antitoxin system PIN domain toxin